MDAPVEISDFLYACFMSFWINRFYIYSCTAFAVGVWIFFQFITIKKKKQGEPPYQNGVVQYGREDLQSTQKEKETHVSGVKIFYGSQTGTAKGFANSLAKEIVALGLPAEVIDMKDVDPDDILIEQTTSKNVCAFLVATYTDGRPTENAEWFSKWLEEASTDFRVGRTYLKGMRYAVFGLGNSVYVNHYNTVGKNIDKWLWMLSASRIMTRAEGDCNVVKSKHGSMEADFDSWKSRFLSQLQMLCKGEKKSCGGKCTKTKCKSKKNHMGEGLDHDQEALGESEQDKTEEELFETTSEEESGAEEREGAGSIIDMEDLGKMMGHMKKAKKEQELSERSGKVGPFQEKNGMGEDSEAREMITPALRDALTKQDTCLQSDQKRKKKAMELMFVMPGTIE